MAITQGIIPSGNSQSPFDGFDLKEQNAAVTKWASMVQRRLRENTSYLSYGKDGMISRPGRIEKKLGESIRASTKKSYGVIDRVTYTFERHGVFVHKGVGRGYEMQGGMVIRTAKSEDPATRKGTWWGDDPRPRTPFEWFNPTLEQTLPELADRLAEINADAVVNATRMMIN